MPLHRTTAAQDSAFAAGASNPAFAALGASAAPLKIVIFGCGYLGVRFARMATQQGHTVSALTRNSQRASELWALGAKNVVQSLLQEDDWHAQLTEPHYDLAVNCVSSGGGGVEGYRLSYLEGMQSLFRWCAAGHRIGHFLYTGSTSVYPQVNGELVSEADVPATQTESGRLLLQAEQRVREGMAYFDRATILRLGAIYGPSRHHLLDCLRRGQTDFPGSGDIIINHVHVDDAIAAICAAQMHAQAPAGCALYNVVDGAYPTKGELVRWLAQYAGVDPQRITFYPQRLSARAARRQVPGQPTGSVPNRRVSNAWIVRTLGWKPHYPSFREGYRSH